MNSKEALDLLYSDAINGNMDENHEYINREEIEREYFEIKQDLDRLESLEAKFDAYYELHKQLEKGYDELSVENDKLIQENRKLKKVIDILKRFVTISYCRNEETNKWDIPLMYSFGFSEKITQEEYDLLKGAFLKCGR